MKKIKTFILYLLALVMVLSLAFALTNTQTTQAATTIPSVDEPLHALATGTADSPYFTVASVSNFSVSGSYTAGAETGSWSGTQTANSGNGNWAILKVTINNTGTFSWTSSMTTYNGGYLVEENDTGTYYYRLVAGSPTTDLTATEIKNGTVVTEGKGNKSHSITITKSNLSGDQVTLYFTFQSNTITSTLGSWLGQGKDSLAISGMSFTYVAPQMQTINFSTVEGKGSITATCNDVAVASGSQVDKGATVKLTANPGGGNQLYYWTVDGEFYSVSKSISIVADADKEIVAEIRSIGYYQAQVGNVFYKSLKSVLDDESITGTVVVVPTPNGITLEQSATVRSGVTLLVPFNENQSHYLLGGNTQNRATWASAPDTYRYSQLNIPQGVELTVNGTLVVGANYGRDSSGVYSMGLISGYYGEIVNNGTITVNGTADIYGLITGHGGESNNGNLGYVANSGSTTTVTFVFIDFAGGSNTSHYLDTGVFPFSQYSFQNIWCRQTVYAGATVKGRAAIYSGDKQNTDVRNVIAPSNEASLLTLSSGYVTIDYDETRYLTNANKSIGDNFYAEDYGKMTISVHGTLFAGSLVVKVKYIFDYSVDSADYMFVVPYSFNISVESGGSLTVPSGLEFAFLPGSNLHVKNGGTLNVEGTLCVVDGLAIAAKEGIRYPDASELKNDGFSASANLFVDGTMNINGTFAGIVQSTSNTGVINVASNAQLSYTFQSGCGSNGAGAGINNTTKVNLTARVGRNSILNADGTVTINDDSNFVNLAKNTTYYAFTNVTGSNTKIQTKLTNVTLAQASGLTARDGVTISGSGAVVNVNSTIQGTFYEKDANGNYLVPLNISIGEATSGVNVGIVGIGSLFTDSNGNLLQNGTTTVTVPMTESGVIQYYTMVDGVKVGQDGNKVAQFNGTGSVILTEVIKSAQLNADTTVIRVFDKDGNYTDQTLQGRLVYYGTDNYGPWENLTNVNNTLAPTDVSGTVSHSLYGVALSGTVYQFTEAMADYQYNCGQLSGFGEDTLVEQAIALLGEWNALITGKNDGEKNFIDSQLSYLNDYFGIYKAFEIYGTATYGDTTATVTATTVGGSKVSGVTVNLGSFAYDNTNGLTGTLSYTGTYVHNGANYSYNVSTTGVAVTPKAITVVVSDVSGHVYGDSADQLLTYALKDGYALVGADSLDNIVSVSRASGLNAGNYNITGAKTGTRAGYYSVTFEYTQGDYSVYSIAPQSITVTVTGTLTVEYGAQIPAYFGTSECPSDANLIVTLDPNASNVGTYNFIITDMGGNYAVTTDTTFTITKRTLNVNISDKTITYGESINPTSIVTLSGALDADKQDLENAIVLQIDGVNATSTTPSAGTHTLTATINASNYNVVYGAPGTLTVNKRTIVVTIDNKESVFGDSLVTLTAQRTGGTLVQGHTLYDVIKLVKEEGNTVKDGGYAITYELLNNNYIVNVTNGVYTINPRPLTVQISQTLTKTYDGSVPDDKTFAFTVTDDAGVYSYVGLPQGTIAYTVANPSANVGSYTITGVVNGATNYVYTVLEGKYTITKKDVTVSFDSASKVYDGTAPTLGESIGVTVVGAVNDVDKTQLIFAVRENFVAIDSVNVGAYDITSTFTGNANYNVGYANAGKFTIQKRPITVQIADKSSTYGDATVDLSATVTGGSLVAGHSLYSGANAIIKLEKEEGNNAGKYAISVNVLNTNYDVTAVGSWQSTKGTYTIEKRALTVSLGNSSSTYGDAIKTSAELYALATVKNVADADKDKQLFALAVRDPDNGRYADETSNVGLYDIVIDVVSIDANYKLANTVNGSGLYQITKRDLTITLGNANRIYNGQEISLDDLSAIDVTLENDLTKDKSALINLVKGNLVAKDNSANVGSYIVESNFNAHANYNITYANQGEYTIDKRQISIEIATNGTSQYGDALDLLSLISVTGENTLVDDVKDVFTMALQAVAQPSALRALASAQTTHTTGMYDILCQNSNDNYELLTVNGNNAQETNVIENAYQITKREITITINDGQKTYNGEQISANDLDALTITWGGIIDENDATEIAELRLALTLEVLNNGENVIDGGYTVTGTFTHDNYTATLIADGTYTITKREITIDFGSVTKTYGDEVASAEELYGQVTVTGSIYGDKQDLFLLTADVTATSGVGFYNVVATDLNSNYDITFAQNFGINSYQITAKEITLVVTAGTSIYGEDIANETVALKSADSLVGSDTLDTLNYSVTHQAEKGNNVGKYDITAQDGNADDNYVISFEFANGINYYEITKREINITVGNDGTKVYNGEPISANDLSAVTVTYSDLYKDEDANNFVVTRKVSGANNANVGDYIVTVDFEDNSGNYKLVNITDGEYKITQRPVSITIDEIQSVTEAEKLYVTVSATMSWDNKALDLNKAVYAIKDGNDIVAYIRNSSVEHVDGEGHIVPFGTYTVVLYSYSDANFNVTDFGSQTLEILVADDSYKVSIDFGSAISGKQYDGVEVIPAITVTERATDDSVDNYTYTVTRGVTDVQDKVIKDVGDYIIRVFVDGKEYGNESFKIAKREITISINDGQKTYNGEQISANDLDALTITWVGIVDENDATELAELRRALTLEVLNNGENVIDGGYTVTGAFTHDNYKATITNGKFTINPRPITVKIDDKESIYGDALETLTVTITSGNMVGEQSIYDYITLTKAQGTTVKYQDGAIVGYTITGLDNSVSDNYDVTFENDGTYTINPRPITVKIDDNESIYGDALETLTVTITSGNMVGEQSIYDYITLTKAQGTTVKYQDGAIVGYTITGLDNSVSDNYDVTFENDGTYTITPRPITVTINNVSNHIYGQAVTSAMLTAKVTDGNTVNNDKLDGIVTLSTKVDNITSVGSYAITGEAINANYTVTIANGTFNVVARPVTVVIDDQSSIYGDDKVTPTATISESSPYDFVNGDKLYDYVTLTNPAEVNVGTYYITGSDKDSSDNYDLTVISGKYVITQREITVTFNATSTVYGDPIKTADELYALAQVTGYIAEDRNSLFVVTTTANVGANAGKYDLVIEDLNPNYKLNNEVDGAGLYEITKRDITVTIGDASKVYDGVAPILDESIDVTIVGALDSDVQGLQQAVRDSFIAITQTNATGYTIASSFAGDLNYNKPTYTNGSYVIEKCGLTVTLGNAESTYGNAVLTSAELYELATVENVADADKDKQLFALATTATSASDVGAYSITVQDVPNANYFIETINDGEGLYTITPRPITVTINNVSNHIYGQAVTSAMLTAKVTDGNTVNNDKLDGIVTLSTKVDNTTSVGSYAITGEAINANYTVTIANGTFNVVARPVTVVIDDQSSIYGDDKVTPTATISESSPYDFVNGDKLYDYVTLTNPAEVNVGTYAITGSDKDISDNYDVTVISGKYTITARRIFVTIGTISKVYDKQPNDLTEVSVTVWYKDGETVVYLTEQLKGNVQLMSVTNTNVGEHTIQATFVGNDNYVVAEDGWTFGTLNITARPITVTIDNATSVYGDKTAQLTSSVTNGNIVEGDTNVYSLSCQVTSTTDVGTYDIIGVKGANANYDVTFENGTYTVIKREIAVKVENTTSDYASPFATPKLTLIGNTSLAEGDILTQVVQPTWSMTNKAGAYEITAQLVDNRNYILSEVENGTYTVTPIALTVTINPITVYYGDAVWTNDQLLAKATVTGTIAESDKDKQLFKFEALAQQTDVVGNYDVEGYGLDDNYTITFVNMGGKYQILKRPVTLYVNDATSVYSNDDSPLTVDVSQGNLVFGHIASEFVIITRTQGSNVGSYNITATKVQNSVTSNYDVTILYTTGDHSVYTITPRPVTFDVSNLTIYNTDSWQKLNSMFVGSVREDIGSDDLGITYKVLMSDNGQTKVFLTEDNFDKEIRLGEFEIQATNGNANYNVTFNYGMLTVTLPKVAVGAINQNFTYSDSGIKVFDWQTQIVDYIPEITTAGAFNAKLIDADGNVILNGSVLEGTVTAGNYTLVIELVHTGQYQWNTDVVTEYQIFVAKLDISNTIVEQGFVNDGWITNSASGVYAMVQDNFDIYVDVTLTVDGEIVYDLTKCGNYTLTAVIDDNNYAGQKTFNFRVIKDIAPTMAQLNTMLNNYSANDDSATRMNNLTAMVELVATIKDPDSQLQIQNNVIYQQLIQNVSQYWNTYVQDTKQDVEVANSIWQNVVVKAVATISALSAAAFLAKRRLGL